MYANTVFLGGCNEQTYNKSSSLLKELITRDTGTLLACGDDQSTEHYVYLHSNGSVGDDGATNSTISQPVV